MDWRKRCDVSEIVMRVREIFPKRRRRRKGAKYEVDRCCRICSEMEIMPCARERHAELLLSSQRRSRADFNGIKRVSFVHPLLCDESSKSNSCVPFNQSANGPGIRWWGLGGGKSNRVGCLSKKFPTNSIESNGSNLPAGHLPLSHIFASTVRFAFCMQITPNIRT